MFKASVEFKKSDAAATVFASQVNHLYFEPGIDNFHEPNDNEVKESTTTFQVEFYADESIRVNDANELIIDANKDDENEIEILNQGYDDTAAAVVEE